MKHKTTRHMKKYIFILSTIASSFFTHNRVSQNISITATGAANSSNSMLEVLQPAGAATGTIGLYINHPGTTGTIYGLQSIVNGTSTTHYAGYFSATNAANNYAIVVPSGGGYAGIGTITPASPLEVDEWLTIGLQNLLVLIPQTNHLAP